MGKVWEWARTCLSGLGLLVMLAPAWAATTSSPKVTVQLIITNAQGSVVGKMTPGGAVTYTAHYRPYGKTPSTPRAGPGYTGHVMDPDSGLVYMNQRYYDPSVGRFISPDPMASTPGNLFNFGKYTYANDNPYSFVDPSGQYACGKNTDKATCAKIRKFVKTLHRATARLKKNSSAYKRLDAVSKHIGTYDDHNGVTLNAGKLPNQVIAEANSATVMTIDVTQAGPLSALFSKYNRGFSASALTNAFGAEAIAHEGQHQLDYLNPKLAIQKTGERNTRRR